MKRHLYLTVFFATIIAGLLPNVARAQPVLLAGAVNKTAFVGDANVTLQVEATGSPAPTLQWQIYNTGNSSFSNITDNATYAGSTTATLTINSPDLTFNGNQYRCKIFSGSEKTNSLSATLSVYAAPSVTPSLTVTPSTIAANSTANVTIKVTGLNAGDTVRIQRVLDKNGDTKAGFDEPVVQSFTVTDGQVTQLGGVTDADIPGDDDGAVDGAITTHITIPTSPESGQLAGSYVIKVSSPTGEFAPVTQPLTVTQPGYGQTISGQVTDGVAPIPNAAVVILANNGDGGSRFVAGTVADANGNYTLAAPVGSYNVIGFALGYVQSFSNAASVTVTSAQDQTGIDLSLTPATSTITSKVVGSDGPALRGVQFFIQSNNNGEVSIVTSDSDGGLVVPLTSASDWDIQISQYSTHALGYLQPQDDPIADTTVAVNGTVVEPSLELTAANALIYGTVEDSQSNPLGGVSMNDNDNNYQDQTTTASDGSYYLLANGPASGDGDNWNVSPSSDNPVLAGYITPPGVDVSVLSGQNYPTNFVAQLVNAHFQGTVTNNGSPVTGVVLDAQPQGGGNNIQATTDSSGNFDLGVGGGAWIINLDNNSADSGNIVGVQLSETISNNQTITGIAYRVVNATGSISGSVQDASGNLLSGANVFGTATIGGVLYSAGAQTDGSGNYTFPVINGTWTLSVGGNTYGSNFSNQVVNVTGSASGVNFVPTVISVQPQSQIVTSGNNANFSISTNAPNSPTILWQVSTDSGGTWTNLTESDPYSGTTSLMLTITNATTDLDGDQYRAVVSYTDNNSNPHQENSQAATLTVNPPPNQPPSFTLQPTNQNSIGGGNVSFTVTADGVPTPTFTWQVSTDGGNTWSNTTDGADYNGSTAATLTVIAPSLTATGYQYRAVANNNVGSPQTGTAATLVVALSGNYLTWLQNDFDQSQLANPAISGPLAQPIQDGVPNLIKYAFNIGSFVNGQTSLPQATSSSGNLVLSFQAPHMDDLNYVVEASTDLVNWSTTGVTTQINGNQITASYALPVSGTAFLRIEVSVIPPP